MHAPSPFHRLLTTLALALPVWFGLTTLTIAEEKSPDIELLGVAELPGTARDLSGLQGEVETGVPVNLLGGFSGLEYTGTGDRYLVLTDRGPADGAATYPCRVQTIELPVPDRVARRSVPRLLATTLLRDEQGATLSGRAALINPAAPQQSLRFDPEALRRSSSGTWWISDEYGPSISEFDAHGTRLRKLTTPAHFLVETPSADRAVENEQNKIGRRSNAGFEALAVSADGRRLWTMVQRPLLQDGTRSTGGVMTGRACRILELEIDSGATREFVYQLDEPTHGVNEFLAFDERRFLAIERDDLPGAQAKSKQIVLVDLDGATPVDGVARLPDPLPATIQTARKQAFLDLLDPRWQLAGESFPEKIEGLAWGRTLDDGRSLLIVASDNDCDPTEPSRFWFFAVRRSTKSCE
ncbi:MAG: esterase-like activity of phytase family protein [Pirellulales bacterium]